MFMYADMLSFISHCVDSLWIAIQPNEVDRLERDAVGFTILSKGCHTGFVKAGKKEWVRIKNNDKKKITLRSAEF